MLKPFRGPFCTSPPGTTLKMLTMVALLHTWWDADEKMVVLLAIYISHPNNRILLWRSGWIPPSGFWSSDPSLRSWALLNPVLDLTLLEIGFRIYILKGLFENFTQMAQWQTLIFFSLAQLVIFFPASRLLFFPKVCWTVQSSYFSTKNICALGDALQAMSPLSCTQTLAMHSSLALLFFFKYSNIFM